MECLPLGAIRCSLATQILLKCLGPGARRLSSKQSARRKDKDSFVGALPPVTHQTLLVCPAMCGETGGGGWPLLPWVSATSRTSHPPVSCCLVWPYCLLYYLDCLVPSPYFFCFAVFCFSHASSPVSSSLPHCAVRIALRCLSNKLLQRIMGLPLAHQEKEQFGQQVWSCRSD